MLGAWVDDQICIDDIVAIAEGGGRHIYLCGSPDWPGLLRAAVDSQSYRDAGSRLTGRPMLRLRGKGGRVVTLWPASIWFGAGDYSPAAMSEAWRRLAFKCRRRFDQGLSPTPGRTGAMTWYHHYGQDWPVQSPEVRSLIRGTTGQGRFEVVPRADPLPALYQLDMRLAYVAAALSIESGPEWVHEERPVGGWSEEIAGPAGLLGYTPARYLVLFIAPETWRHVGLLPARDPGGWEWPIIGKGWADACEVRLAIEQGWRVEILERVRALPFAGGRYRRPLEQWARRWLALMPEGEHADSLEGTAIRNILLQSIGWLGMGAKVVTRSAEDYEDVPDDDRAQRTAREEGGRVLYDEEAEASRTAALVAHPELSAAIWANRRRWLLSGRRRGVDGQWVSVGALHVAPEAVVGMAQDAIYLTHDPGWEDDGSPGRYRLKRHMPGPLAAPKDLRELYALTGEGEHHE